MTYTRLNTVLTYQLAWPVIQPVLIHRVIFISFIFKIKFHIFYFYFCFIHIAQFDFDPTNPSKLIINPGGLKYNKNTVYEVMISTTYLDQEYSQYIRYGVQNVNVVPIVALK